MAQRLINIKFNRSIVLFCVILTSWYRCISSQVNDQCKTDMQGLTNGCSVPLFRRFPYKKTFKPACNRHDICYECASYYERSSSYCDNLFYNDLLDICLERRRGRSLCFLFAFIYYGAVKLTERGFVKGDWRSDCMEDWIRSCLLESP